MTSRNMVSGRTLANFYYGNKDRHAASISQHYLLPFALLRALPLTFSQLIVTLLQAKIHARSLQVNLLTLETTGRVTILALEQAILLLGR